jgi:hypothetical protein
MPLTLPFCPVKVPFDGEYVLSLFAVAGLYGLTGGVLAVTSPLSAAAFGIASMLSTRVIQSIFDKWGYPAHLAQKVIYFVSSFFLGSLISAFAINALGLSFSFAAGMLLHGAILSTLLSVTLVALPCILCIGAAIGVRLLPD